jgi:hypothetical protein
VHDTNIQAYRSERALHHLVSGLVGFWVAVALPLTLTREHLVLHAESLVRGWSIGSLKATELPAFARAAIAVLIRELGTEALASPEQSPESQLDELAVLCEVLADRSVAGS